MRDEPNVPTERQRSAQRIRDAQDDLRQIRGFREAVMLDRMGEDRADETVPVIAIRLRWLCDLAEAYIQHAARPS